MNKNTYIFIIVVVIVLAGLGIWQFKNKEPIVEQENSQAGQRSFSPDDDSVVAIDKDLESFEVGDVDFRETDSDIDSLSTTN